MLRDRRLLIRSRLDAFPRRRERDEEEDDRERREDADRDLVALGVVALAEVVHHRERQALDDQLRIMAHTKRYDDRLVRSPRSPVMTPLSAEYGRLFAEYTIISAMYVM